MSSFNIQELLDGAWSLVRQNLPQTLSLRSEITWKSDGSPVTRADYLHEELISEFLQNRLPDVQMVAEESYQADMNLTNQWVAVLDPIDGTENFCSGLKEWGVALSIWRDGEHQGSALMLPEMGDVIFSGRKVEKFDSRIVGLSSSYNEEIGKIISDVPESRIMGCAVYNMYNVIRGSFDRFVNPKGAYCWDLQAGVSLALENGCEVYLEGELYNGRLLDPNRRHRVDVRHRYDLHPGQGAVG
jgi:myo-inositol-1(or 4)-monophosphatase